MLYTFENAARTYGIDIEAAAAVVLHQQDMQDRAAAICSCGTNPVDRMNLLKDAFEQMPKITDERRHSFMTLEETITLDACAYIHAEAADMARRSDGILDDACLARVSDMVTERMHQFSDGYLKPMGIRYSPVVLYACCCVYAQTLHERVRQYRAAYGSS